MGTPENEEPVEPIFRNGTVTVVGIVLSLSARVPLPMGRQSIAHPGDRRADHRAAFGRRDSPDVCAREAARSALDGTRVYNHAKNAFLVGVAATGAGVILALVVDLFRVGTFGPGAG